MKYLNKEDIKDLNDKEFEDYVQDVTDEQLEILELMDEWVDHYNLLSDEYNRRLAKRSVRIEADSSVIH